MHCNPQFSQAQVLLAKIYERGSDLHATRCSPLPARKQPANDKCLKVLAERIVSARCIRDFPEVYPLFVDGVRIIGSMPIAISGESLWRRWRSGEVTFAGESAGEPGRRQRTAMPPHFHRRRRK